MSRVTASPSVVVYLRLLREDRELSSFSSTMCAQHTVLRIVTIMDLNLGNLKPAPIQRFPL